jgi:hypothetical protein
MINNNTISVYTSRELRPILAWGDFGSAGLFLFNKKWW